MSQTDSRWVVLKFGGTSVATATRWETIARLVEQRIAEGFRPLVVCSALAGISNRLEAMLERAVAGDYEATRDEIRRRHLELGAELGLPAEALLQADLEELSRLALAAALLRDAGPALKARVMALGELLSTRLGAAFLQTQGIATAWLDARTALLARDEPHARAARAYLSASCEAELDPTLVARLGEPLINEAVIPIGQKDRWNRLDPEDDGQFESLYTSPEVSRLENALYGSVLTPISVTGRNDLVAILLTGVPGLNFTGPKKADLLRLNTGIPPTPVGSQKRLGFLAGDTAGFPNGRRPVDDVVDIASRAVAGILVDPVKFGTRIGDGVQANPEGLPGTFPYVAPANNGRNGHHIGPGQVGCTGQPDDICPVQ